MSVCFNVKDDLYHEVTRERDPEDIYSGEDTITTHSIVSVDLTYEKNFDVSGDMNENELLDKIFLTYVIYSTGDSFSREEGAGIEYLECFITEEKATELAETIEIQNSIFKSMDSTSTDKKIKKYFQRLKDINIITELEAQETLNGKVFNEKKFLKDLSSRLYFRTESGSIKFTSVPWSGYFEVLESVNVEHVRVENIVNIKKSFKI